jgi:type III restriction enzyme
LEVGLKDYQLVAADRVLRALRRATRAFEEDGEYSALSLAAPTGAGKTVIATAVIEELFTPGTNNMDPNAVILWVTDDPSLNEQTRRKMITASSSLKPAQLVTINAAFDQRTLEARNVYFLNIQKLGRSTSYVKDKKDRRSYSLWTTLANTIKESGGHFYVIIDEAHRGTKTDKSRQTIVSRIISDTEGVLPPSPVVWGISATPERFQQAMGSSSTPGRLRADIPVPIEDVRESGLVKDKILIKHPTEKQPGGATLTRLAVSDLQSYDAQWAAYSDDEDEPPVRPVLVVQVPARVTDAALIDLLATLREAWPDLNGRAVAHTFESHTALTLRGQSIRYVEPQNIQDDPDLRVVFFKEALTTGWDCPRAEVMLSFRKADDYTYMAQLIGRMVRTPLARRIVTNDVLNTVGLFLPQFDETHVNAVIDRLRQDPDAPTSAVEKNPVTCPQNPKVDRAVFELLHSLPTYVVPGRAHRSQVARLHTLAALLAGDGIDEQAIAKADQHLIDTLTRERSRLAADGTFDRLMEGLATITYQSTTVNLRGNEPDEIAAQVAAADPQDIDALLKGAARSLPDGLAKTYWGHLVDHDDDPDEAKLATAALAGEETVAVAVEAAAEGLVQTWLRTYSRTIADLPEAKKVKYYAVRAQARNSELVDMALPSTITASWDHPPWDKHLYATGDGFPAKLTSWEEDVLKAELNPSRDLVAWYRNPTGGERALRVPYRDGDYDRPMYPDFVFFHDYGETIRPSIVDPHNYAWADTGPKWRGLAAYASSHGDAFARIDAVIKDESGVLLRLDLKDPTIQELLETTNGKDQIRNLFRTHGGEYT